MTKQKPFRWAVGVTQSALVAVMESNLRGFHLDKEVCRQAYDTGRKRVSELFGHRIGAPSVSCPAVSYGHLASLGAHIQYPDNSEPNVEPLFSSVREGIAWLKKDHDFSKNEVFQRYYDTWQYLQKFFPDEQVLFSGYGHQGPVTSAVLLRGQDFYMDLYDEPELTKEFLELLTDNIIQFNYFIRAINGLPAVDPVESYLADDFSSLVSPWLWPEFVVPYWNQYYAGLTKGKRNIHVENLIPDHLDFFRQAGIDYYDPSVSQKLSPAIIRKHLDIDFSWRLLSMQVLNMTEGEVRDWVLRNVAEGAPYLYTYITDVYCMPQHQNKAFVFMNTCEELDKKIEM